MVSRGDGGEVHNRRAWARLYGAQSIGRGRPLHLGKQWTELSTAGYINCMEKSCKNYINGENKSRTWPEVYKTDISPCDPFRTTTVLAGPESSPWTLSHSNWFTCRCRARSTCVAKSIKLCTALHNFKLFYAKPMIYSRTSALSELQNIARKLPNSNSASAATSALLSFSVLSDQLLKRTSTFKWHLIPRLLRMMSIWWAIRPLRQSQLKSPSMLVSLDSRLN